MMKRDREESHLKTLVDNIGMIAGLNLCFLLGCLPVITAGASLASLYAICIKLQEGDTDTVFGSFMEEYKKNLKPGIKMTLILMLVIAVFYGEIQMILLRRGVFSSFYTVLLVAELILLSLTLPLIFPLMGRYENGVLQTIKNSFLLAISYPASWLKLFLFWFAPAVLCMHYPLLWRISWSFWLLFLFGLIGYLSTIIVRKIFDDQEAAAEAKKEGIAVRREGFFRRTRR